MQRTRVGQAIPAPVSQPTVAERIIGNWAKSQREEFSLAMQQAQQEYNEGRTSRAEYLKQRQDAIDALRKDLSALQKSRDDLRKGAITRLDAAERFNAGAVNAARRTYSGQAMTAQASDLRSRQLADKTKQVLDDSGLPSKAAKELYNVVLENLTNNPDDPELTVFNAVNTAALAPGEYEEIKNIPPDKLQEVAGKMSRQIQSFRLNPDDVSEIRAQMLQQERLGPSTLPPIEGEEGVEPSFEEEPASIPGIGIGGVRPVGYRPALVQPDISGEMAELDRIRGRELDIMGEIENLQRQMQEYKMDDFDLIDRTREIWRQKFGRQPSKEETRAVMGVVKQKEPISAEIKTTPIEPAVNVEPTLPEPTVSEPTVSEPTVSEPAINVEPTLPERPEVRTVPAEEVEALRQAYLRERFEVPEPRGRVIDSTVPRDLTPREMENLRETTRVTPPAPIRPPTPRPGSLGLLDSGMEDVIIQPEPTPTERFFTPTPQKLPFEEEEDIYQKAEEKYRSGQITAPPIDRKTIDKMIEIWKSSGKRQTFEVLLETVEKAFDDRPEDKLASNLAYFMKKFKEFQG